MARIHARTKGKSGSKRPVKADLSFVKISAKDVVKVILELNEQDKSPSMIGLILRDNYGVPSVKALVGKSVTTILEENNKLSKMPEDLQALVEKTDKLKKHLVVNTRDVHNKRGLILLRSKIRRLSKYYKSKGRIEDNWNYN